MDSNGQDKDYKITQDNISQIRKRAQISSADEQAGSEEQFYAKMNRQNERIEQLVQKIEAFPDPAAQALLAECVEAILSLHGSGLKRILAHIDKTEGSTDELKENLFKDDFIKGLFLLHGVHPEDLESRLYRALEKVKPYMDSHGGSVQVVSLKNGVAKLKLEGSCDGCPSSASTLELGIKEAIEEECPDLKELQVEGVADNPLSREIRNLNQKDKNGKSSQKSPSNWTNIKGVGNLTSGDKKSLKINDTPVVLCKSEGNYYAYRNECPGCGMTFDTGELENGKLRCKLGHQYDVQQAGKCDNDPDLHLDPFPLLVEQGKVKVNVG